MALLRRVDRRFREAEHEADSLRSALASRQPSEALTAEVACLELKVASAARARDRVRGGRLSAERRAKLEPLNERLGRHAAGSYTAAARVASALMAAPTSRIAIERRPSLAARLRAGLPSIQWASTAVAVLFVAIVIGSFASRAGRPSGEGMLSGVPGVTSETSASDGVTGPRASAAPPSAAPAPIALQAGFDDQRIGPITDVAWMQPPAEARVVAFPTPFDRSLEVRTTDGNALEACISPGSGNFVTQSLSADLRLDDDVASVATIGLRSESGPGTEIGLGADRSSVTHGGTPVGSANGLERAAWYQVRVDATAEDIGVQVWPIDGGSAIDIPVEIEELLPAQAVCFGVSGEAGASVHYDNLTATFQRSTEQ